MWNKLLSLIAPFSLIAKELAIIRELYELDLASRPQPIRRATEAPGKSDTEITYMGEDVKPKSALQRLKEAWDEIPEDES